MKPSRIITAAALALSLTTPALAGHLKQTWTLEGQQVVTGTYSTDMSSAFFIANYDTKKECYAALAARVEIAGVQPPPCLPNQVQPPACSMSATRLSCSPSVYGVME